MLWFLELQRTIRDLGGDETFESTLFRVQTDAQFLLVLVYVDDLLIASNDVEGGENFLRRSGRSNAREAFRLGRRDFWNS